MPRETLINVIFRLAGNFVAEHQPWFDCAYNRGSAGRWRLGFYRC